ncbi:hypothetical protein NM208_g6195 [Fusarium decemcellulare]|uniref:Uncharacterized protein n=1 Tax=Fusarium decemcellulare TaxID=57161 RepID=A0ACC1SDY6_9HYPO|nr:hypothetical protein NM208_g6195 [Fusarium decemcellulare]
MATKALVVGGTGGIGYAIACRVAANPASSVIVSGRTKPKDFPHNNMEFRALDASSMRSIKQYTDQFKLDKDNNPNLDLLVLSQGIFTTAGRTETPEKIDRKMALHYYGRQLLIRELLPVLKEDAKVLIVLDSTRGDPAKLNWEDLDLKTHFSLSNTATHCVTMTDAMIQAYSTQQKGQSGIRRHFIHAAPGIVKTDIYDTLPWYQRVGLRGLSNVLGVSPETCAENLLKGTYESAASREKEDKFWSCIDGKGHAVPNKPTWTAEQIQLVVDHTWRIVDNA